MNAAKYQELLDDLEEKRVFLQVECDNLKKELNSKGRYLTQVSDSITVIKGLLEIEFPETETAELVSIEINQTPVSSLVVPKNQNGIESSVIEFNKQNQSSITLNDGVEKILIREGKALHADKLVEYLRELGRYTDKRNLNSGMLKDSKKRFVLLGGNVFDLHSRRPHLLFPAHSVGDTKLTNKEHTSDFILIDAVREVIKEFYGKEFAVSDVFEKIVTKFPNDVDESRQRSVASTVNNLKLKGELEKVRVGTFDKPALYRAKQW